MNFIGKPYEVGATGPDSYDCAGLAAAVWRDVFGMILPCRENTADARRTWRSLALPEDGAIVMMKADGTHIGVWLAEGGVIHALEERGVIFDSPHVLALRGYSNLRFYLPP